MKSIENEEFNPLVSIVIPVYNGSDYMRDAIDSALAQTYPNCEIVIVNDGSTDNGETEKIALSYGDKIRYFSKPNGGVSSAMNYGVRHMKGDYFSWLSHDDRYEHDKVKRQVELLKKYNRDKAVVICDLNCIDGNGNKIPFTQKRRELPEECVIHWKIALEDLLKNETFYGCTMLINKNVMEECGLFNESMRYSQDYLFCVEMCLNKNDFIYTKEELVQSRIHGGQLSQTGRQLYHKEAVEIGNMVIDRFADVSSKEQNFLYFYAIDMAIYDNPSVLRKCIRLLKEKHLMGFKDYVRLQCVRIYGKIRPFLRKIYYATFRGFKTR